MTETPKTCTVVAPQTLDAGYTFNAQVDGIDFVVTVPEGGVTEGQAFEVPYPSKTGATNATPATNATASAGSTEKITGRWRNDLCSCCDVIGNGMFWQAWCCCGLLLGQLMQRHKLNFIGSPSPDGYQNTFYIVAAVWVVFIILVAVAAKYIVYVCYIFLAIAFTQTRYAYRKTYQIPPSTCDCFDGRCDDFCCGWWCGCCASIQMARHTHDVREYPYQCCGPTGLPTSAPEIV